MNRARGRDDYSESISNGYADSLRSEFSGKTKMKKKNTIIILNTNWDVIVCVVRHMCWQMGTWYMHALHANVKIEREPAREKKNTTQKPIHSDRCCWVLLVRDNSIWNAWCLCVNRVKTQRLLFDLCRRTMAALVEVQNFGIERLHPIGDQNE